MTNSNIRGKKNMPEPDRWLCPRQHQIWVRLCEIQRMQSHIPSYCPECGEPLTVDDEQIYCPRCGLVTQDSYDYQAGQKFTLPHGLRLG